jgi:hypothetical protein
MNLLLKKHLGAIKQGKYMVIISPRLSKITNYTTFNIATNPSGNIIMSYVFIDNVTISLQLVLLLMTIFTIMGIKSIVSFTNDIVAFSLCEKYLMINQIKQPLCNCFVTKTGKVWNNITFYDYEELS